MSFRTRGESRQLGVGPGPTAAVRYYVLNPWSPVLDDRARRALLELADAMADDLDPRWKREIYALIDPTNQPSQRVAHKCGFVFWRHDFVDGYHDDLLVRPLGRPSTP